MGVLIVFEGGEGAGKTTQARILYRHLARGDYPTVLTREPGGTRLGEAVRRWLKSRHDIVPLTELLLFTAARAQHVEEIIAPALGAHKVVICDRFTASTVAYQGYGRGLDLELITRLNVAATGDLRPDVNVFLDVPVEQGLGRKKVSSRDNFESESVEFHHRVREGYLSLASREPDQWIVVDGTLNKKPLAAQVWGKVQSLL